MIAVQWSRSWHLERDPLATKAFCGRIVGANATWRDRLPGDEKTCERCAVIAAKRGLTFASPA